MQYFNYRAIDSAGAVQCGRIAAISTVEVDLQLSRRGLELIVCKPSHAVISFLYGTRRARVTRRQLIDFTFHVQQMTSAGVPLLDSLKEFRDGAEHKHLCAIVADLIDKIESGSSLSQACSAHRAVFRPIYTSMLKAGEDSGRLVEVLADLSSLLKWQDETISSIQRVLIYPAFVSVVLFVVIGFVMTWLVPSLLSFITSAGGELPWHTHWLIAVSNAITHHGLAALMLLVVGVISLSISLRGSSAARQWWHQLQLKLPLAGPVLYKIKLARFCRCAALMYASGITLIDTLKHGESLVDNLVLSKALRSAREQVMAGEKVSNAFQSQRELPPLLTRLIRVGESTGGMDSAFMQASYFYERASRESIDRLEQFIGPVLIVFVGAIMSWVVLSVIGPIYDLVFSMQGAM